MTVTLRDLSYPSLSLGLLLAFAGCGASNGHGPDAASPPDASDRDARSQVDAGDPDGAAPDAAPPDDSGAAQDASSVDGSTRDGAADGSLPTDASSPDASVDPGCSADEDCDDGQPCTEDRCEDGLCIHASTRVCDWPAEPTRDAENLTSVGRGEFSSDLSGAFYNPRTDVLWVCRNNGPSTVWALERDDSGDWRIAARGGRPAVWSHFGDAEAITQADLADEDGVFVLDEARGTVRWVDLSVGGDVRERRRWDLSAHIGGSGGEGMTFIPDAFLTAQGFVDGSGAPYVSRRGLGGLILVGHQGGGHVYAFDLDPDSDAFDLVGRYRSAAAETAGLEFDRSTGQLFLWHDADFDQLEVSWLSSHAEESGERRLDTVARYDGPAPLLFMSTNIEGIAIEPIEACTMGTRGFYFTIDGGRLWSLYRYARFPC